jgi:hypothetical protein
MASLLAEQPTTQQDSGIPVNECLTAATHTTSIYKLLLQMNKQRK